MPEQIPAKELSKIFFNRGSRLIVWHAIMQRTIDPPEAFRGKEIHDDLPDENRGEIGKELCTLAAFNAIVVMPGYDNDHHSKYFRRVDSTIWSVVQELSEKTTELSS